MSKKLTRNQIKNFVRIQTGLIIMHNSGCELMDSYLKNTDTETKIYEEIEKTWNKFLKNNSECKLGGTDDIINHVRNNF